MRVSRRTARRPPTQRDALIAASVDPAHLYEDQASGKRRIARPASCLKALRYGDTLVVWKLDQLRARQRHQRTVR